MLFYVVLAVLQQYCSCPVQLTAEIQGTSEVGLETKGSTWILHTLNLTEIQQLNTADYFITTRICLNLPLCC